MGPGSGAPGVPAGTRGLGLAGASLSDEGSAKPGSLTRLLGVTRPYISC